MLENGAEPQLLVSVPNIPGLNPKSLLCVHDVKAYVLLIVTHPSDRDIKPGGLLGAFR